MRESMKQSDTEDLFDRLTALPSEKVIYFLLSVFTLTDTLKKSIIWNI
jgi:hypothetical protein